MSQLGFKHSIKVPRFYKAAALVYSQVKSGANIKAVINDIKHPNKRGIMALVLKTLQFSNVTFKVFDESEILQKETNLDENLASVLITELLWGKRILEGESKPIQTILKYQDELMLLVNKHGFAEPVDIKATIWRPRYIRVNTIKQQPSAVINFFTKRAWQKLEIPDKYPKYLEFIKSNLKDAYFAPDFHFNDVLLFPFGTVFAKNPLFKNGSFLLQDKSSCMATHILSPEPGSTVLDMCAAPGMKTSHLAALMKNRGKIYAIDHDKIRFATLKETIKRCKLKCVQPIRADVLKITKINAEDIDYILLDPSCSGSGMLSRLSYEKPDLNPNRLKKLSNLQSKLLRHALTQFPNAKRVVYSTCSVDPEENEAVVDEALNIDSNFKLIDCSKIFKHWFNFGSSDFNCGKKCIKSVPEVDCMNGFFIAAFERIFK